MQLDSVKSYKPSLESRVMADTRDQQPVGSIESYDGSIGLWQQIEISDVTLKASTLRRHGRIDAIKKIIAFFRRKAVRLGVQYPGTYSNLNQMSVRVTQHYREEADWMDVDGEDQSTPNKRAKANSGAAVAKGKREPRSDRRLAGMRDSAVRIFGFCARRRDADDVCGVQQASKAIKLRDLGQRRPNMLAKAGESDRAIKVKMV